MVKPRIIWLLSWLGSLAFLIIYQQWLAWLMLGAVLLIPLFSLLISGYAMLTARLEASAPGRLTAGTEAVIQFRCVSKGIPPQWNCRVLVTHGITGKRKRLRSADPLPTDHSGVLFCHLTRVRVYDYLGLFALPLRGQRNLRVVVEPKPVPIPHSEEADADAAFAWKPKNGGFSENHELRLYAPGDNLRQIHWKLSAKTGKLIIREPMEPQRDLMLLTLDIRGTGHQQDRKFGRLLWLGRYLLEKGFSFEIRALSGRGLEVCPVSDSRQLHRALENLLCAPPAEEGSILDQSFAASWQFYLGGDADETR